MLRRKCGARHKTAMGQKAKCSLRADVFCFGPNNGHRSIGSACPFGAQKRKWGRPSGEGQARCSQPHHESALCGSLDQSKLRQGRHAIVEAYLLDNLAVLELQNGRTGELHLAPRVRGQ